MSDTESSVTGISLRGIQADAYFSVRVVQQLERFQESGGNIAHIMAPWWSLYLHEGRDVLRRRLPELHPAMSDEASKTFEQARHGLKMFLDTKRDVTAYEEYFAKIQAAHRERFVERVRLGFRWMANDLGVTTYLGKVVATTHGVAFATGLEPEAVLDEDMGLRLKRLWTEAGGSFAFAALTGDGPPPLLSQTWQDDKFISEDFKSHKYYSKIFCGPEHPHLNAVLLHYLGMVNSADLLFPLVFDLESDEYTIFKIRYLVTSHVIGSLEKLAEGDRALPETSTNHLIDLLSNLPSVVSTERPWLRNLLVHYEPNVKSDFSRFDRDRLLAGVVSIAEVPETLNELVELTNRNLRHLADGLNEWMVAPEATR